MKVFVTVGTTRFPSLIRYFDQPSRSEIVLQTADPGYQPKHVTAFDFTGDVRRYHEWADVIVTHAGAGSVYDLLERKRRIVVVPNLERSDKHQLDLARYVAAERYALVVERLSDHPDPDALLDAAVAFNPRKYVKDAFFKADYLLQLLR